MIEKVAAFNAGPSAFGSDAQHGRLLRIDFPQEDGPQATLLVNRLYAKEELSRCFHVDAELLSDDPRIGLKAVVGRMVTISLVREDGSVRYFNGYVTAFHFVRADGGFAFYRMVLEPWLAFARHRYDCACFLERTVADLTSEILLHYQQRDVKFHLLLEHERRDCMIQLNESDYNHLHRRWEAAGIHYHYEHRFDGHTLHLSDTCATAPSVQHRGAEQGCSSILFAGADGAIEQDGIQHWEAARRFASSAVRLVGFEDTWPGTAVGDHFVPLETADGRSRTHERYEYAGANAFASNTLADAVARVRLERLDAEAQDFIARGNDRRAQPGRRFKLDGHFSSEPRNSHSYEDRARHDAIAKREYLIVAVTHTASNNYQAGQDALSHYENEFSCVRADRTWQPSRNHNSQPCDDPGTQTATVVGSAGDAVDIDAFGRIKVRFHWDRCERIDDRCSAWIRVMTPAAGPQHGYIRPPRGNEEGVVQFLDGNVDHPIIIGFVYNGDNRSPWTLPGQSALQGMRSRELGGTRGNQLVFDDTAGKIQAQLRSDHLSSQLSLGYITRIDGNVGRQEARGEGWELRTDGHGVMRAARGLLVTTEARSGGSGSAKDMGETTQRLVRAVDTHDQVAQLAKDNAAHDAGANQTEVCAGLKRQVQGVDGGPLESGVSTEFKQPHLILSSPAGIASTTAGNTHLSSEQHTALSTGKSLSIGCGTSFLCSVRDTLRLFAYKAGMKLVAAAGNIELKALTDSINLLAKLNITQTANRITISAKEELVINGGGSYARFAAGSLEMGTTGSFVAHAATHSLPGGKSVEMSHTMPPVTKSAAKGVGVFHVGTHGASSGAPGRGLPFILYKDGAAFENGHVDERGNISFKHELEEGAKYELELAHGQRYVIEAGDCDEQHLASAGVGYHGYQNTGGSLTDDCPSLEDDRLWSDPGVDLDNQADSGE